MTDNPLVSVTVAVYNGARYLGDALRSIFAQDYRPFETIVVDDGSTDDTAAIAWSFPEVRYVHQENQGTSVARNRGIEEARGELIAFLDADDLWPSHKLSAQVAHLRAHPEVGFVVANERLFFEDGAELPPGYDPALMLVDHPAYNPGAQLVRRALFDELGGFDPGYRISEDTDWIARALDTGVKSAVLPQTLLFRRFHGENLSGDARRTTAEIFDVLRRSVARKRAGAGGIPQRPPTGTK